MAEAFIAEGGRPALTRIVPNGLDIEPGNPPKALLRRSLACPPQHSWRIQPAGHRGRDSTSCCARLLGCRMCSALLPGVRCSVKAHAEILRTLASNLGIENRVTFLGQRSDVPQLMRAVDIVIHSSVDPEPSDARWSRQCSRGLRLSRLTAGAAAEILAGGEAGKLVPAGDADALTEAIRGALVQLGTLALQNR